MLYYPAHFGEHFKYCTDTYFYVKNQYKRDVIEDMIIYVMVIENFHKIIKWYMKDTK